MPKSWKDDLRVWKGQRKYIPYEDLKQSIEGKVRDLQAQERYTLAKGTPKTTATKSDRALVAVGPTSTSPTHGNSYNNTCSYCDRPRHAIRHCRSLQKDLRTGHVKAGTVLPANVVFKGNSKREYPKNKGKNKRNGNGAGGNYNGNRGKDRQRQNRQESSDYDDYRRSKSRERKRRQDDSDDDDEADGNRRKVFRQERRESGLIAVATAINPPLSLTAQANVDMDTTWTIDSGATRRGVLSPSLFGS
ncbi:hypothetical protein PHYSODRAFT_341146 [Phytophthora sojae]|uniref:Uncharacterized protein n=1 Tax=Phytophthora sojae (strain P6497) TaxID=1094619 RepID=G5ACB7_PHYSP|nr:hypothetical protein PHYSODRAFT_341146 [Phytophthora sojae]EGZ06991.1 hypothetical protein PHYSODRAFT_341146 [Phytophthora sojae]|eukprot:XP_009537755.1 hypothetical protein PHYSODRAFT_341146 [Phytophthora sojae]